MGNPFWNFWDFGILENTFLGFLIFVKFQAVIKSAASAASQRPNQGIKSGNPRSGERPDDGARWDDGVGRATDRIRATARGAPLILDSLIWPLGGCASSRLDHMLEILLEQEVRLAAHPTV